MNQNIWKILAIAFFAVALIEFIWGYSSIKNAETTSNTKLKDLETSTSIRIKELEMRIQQDSIKREEGKLVAPAPCPPGVNCN